MGQKKSATQKKAPARGGRRDSRAELWFNEEQGRRLARGWPHYRELVDARPEDENAKSLLAKAVDAVDPAYHVEWPVTVAHGFARAMGAGIRTNDLDTLPATDPLTEEEARTILRHLVMKRTRNYEFKVWDVVFLLEAMFGGEVVADALLSAYESSKTVWKAANLHDPVKAILPLGYVLLRLGSHRKDFDERIRRLMEGPGAGAKLSDFFGLTLGGAEAADRHHYSNRLPICHFVTDDPHFVCGCADKCAPFLMDARFVFLGGEQILESYLPKVRQIPAHRVESFVQEMSIFNSHHVVAIFLLLATNKRVKDRIRLWCQEHEDLAKPVLEAAASDSGAAVRKTGLLPDCASSKTSEKITAMHGPKLVAAASSLLADMSTSGPGASEESELTPEAAELRFDELTQWVADELGKSLGDAVAEQVVLSEAKNRFAEIRSALGEEPEEALIHFLGADGVGYEKQRKPAFKRVQKAVKKDIQRWAVLINVVES